MARVSHFGIAFLACVLVTLASSDYYRACDNEGASDSVGACYVPGTGEYLCSSHDGNQGGCESNFNNGKTVHWEVLETFPTKCKPLTEYNCNEPLANCRRGVQCEYKDGKCTIKAGTGQTWMQEKQRTSVKCVAKE